MAGDPRLKVFSIPLDLKRPGCKRPVEVVDGDTGNELVITLTDGDEALDAEGLHIMAVFSSSRGVSVQDSEDGSVTADGNEITVALAPASFAPGPVECELQLYSSSEEGEEEDVLVTTARFNFQCRAAMLNDGAIHAVPQLPVLTSLIGEVEAAEAARQAAEEAREAAEAGRQAAEEAREAAEEAREERLDSFIDYVGVGVKTINTVPGASDGDALGRIYLLRDGNAAYICTAANIHAGTMRFSWRKLAFDSPWTDIGTFTLGSDVSRITLNEDQNGDSFEWDELMITIIGSMKNSMIANVYVNGSNGCIKDTSFMTRDASVLANNICCVHLKKMEDGFAIYERSSGGTGDSNGIANAKTPQTGFLKIGANEKYTGVEFAAGVDAGRFASGTVIRLRGRNLN